MIIDTHVHLWDNQALKYSWLSFAKELDRRFDLEDYYNEVAKAKADIKGVVVVQADCDKEYAREEVAMVKAMADAQNHVELKGMVAYIDLLDEKNLLDNIAFLKSVPFVKGIRFSLQNEDDAIFTNETHINSLIEVAKAGLSIDFCTRQKQMPLALELAKKVIAKVPTCHIILDHLSKPDLINKDLALWHEYIEQFASLPNVYCKLSGLGTEANWESWSVEDIKEVVKATFDNFGPTRTMFGGDFPVVNLAGGLTKWYSAINELTKDLTLEDKESFFAKTAIEAYRL